MFKKNLTICETINKVHALQSFFFCCLFFIYAHQPQLIVVTLTRCGYEVEERRRVGAMQRGGMGEQGGPVAKPVIACVCCQRDRCASV